MPISPQFFMKPKLYMFCVHVNVCINIINRLTCTQNEITGQLELKSKILLSDNTDTNSIQDGQLQWAT